MISHEAFARCGGPDKTRKRLLKQLMKQVDALKVVLSNSESEDVRVHKEPDYFLSRRAVQ